MAAQIGAAAAHSSAEYGWPIVRLLGSVKILEPVDAGQAGAQWTPAANDQLRRLSEENSRRHPAW